MYDSIQHEQKCLVVYSSSSPVTYYTDQSVIDRSTQALTPSIIPLYNAVLKPFMHVLRALYVCEQVSRRGVEYGTLGGSKISSSLFICQ